MKLMLKIFVAYCDHKWIQVLGVILPCVGYSVLVADRIGLGARGTPAQIRNLADSVGTVFSLVALALLGILAAVIRNMLVGRKASAHGGLRLFLIMLLVVFVVFVILMPPMMFRSSS